MPTVVYLVRHGMTEWNAAGRLAGRLPGIRLSAHGRREAEAAAARLAAAPVRVVVTSPLDRTRETADLIARAHGFAPVCDDAFVERGYPAWQGLRSSEIRDRFPEAVDAVARSVDVPGVEPAGAMADRMLAGLERLVAGHPDETLVIVSHADPIRALIARIAGMPPARLRAVTIDTASVSRIRRHGRRTVVDYLNSRAHLEAPGAIGRPAYETPATRETV